METKAAKAILKQVKFPAVRIATTSNYGAFGLNLKLLQDALGLARG